MKKILILGISILAFTSCAEEDENGCYCDFYEPVYNESTGNFENQFVERKEGLCADYETDGYITEGNCE
ncbi:hypothetical protein SAMN05216480_102247 [Pustulibacterium marinum]|uniref:Lipoprotein n=1 Tax=Pustulibacterium marinum TaxID=1224947 RepID=A0A1I7FUL4_9FLAO|nr:hypothetical protein [Pustulibacterium marinum]SFU39848.1 hypothetical protein SAMN05216480_102247 [Pustulibacterium marinum]